MTFLSLLEQVPLQVLVFAVLLALLPFAGLALVVAGRKRSDIRAAAVTQAQRPRRLPSNLATRMWDFDEKGRTW
ncbi:MAG: hypothetical protein JWO67_2404 [Streptosporangiaceae bacterium]|nr:hypothetical protein [Streptosporangiaceae bacterium]